MYEIAGEMFVSKNVASFVGLPVSRREKEKKMLEKRLGHLIELVVRLGSVNVGEFVVGYGQFCCRHN